MLMSKFNFFFKKKTELKSCSKSSISNIEVINRSEHWKKRSIEILNLEARSKRNANLKR